MRLTKRQIYILYDWLGCGDSRECDLTNQLINAIQKKTTAELYKSDELKAYYNYHKDGSWWDNDDLIDMSYDGCYKWILEMLVDLIDYSEFETNNYLELDNHHQYNCNVLNGKQKSALVRVIKRAIDDGEFLYDDTLDSDDIDNMIDTVITDYDMWECW